MGDVDDDSAAVQQALEQDRAERDARVMRTVVVRDGARDVVGEAPARAVRIPGEGWEFEVLMKDGRTLYVLIPRSNQAQNNPGRRAPESRSFELRRGSMRRCGAD